MIFMSQNKLDFSFKYDGASFEQVLQEAKLSQEINDNFIKTQLCLKDGLVITKEKTVYPDYDAEEWVLTFENAQNNNSKILSNIFDCDISVSAHHQVALSPLGYAKNPDCSRVYVTQGSNCTDNEFMEAAHHLPPGSDQTYSCEGGRSSSLTMPFFDFCEKDSGVLIAIGWSGQWQANFSSKDECVRITTGIQDANFYLEPNEKLRTSRVVLMRYSQGRRQAHTMFRRLVKDHFSIIGKPNRAQQGPLCLSAWGGMSSKEMIDRLRFYKDQNFGAEYFWVDAGWYGDSKLPCPDEFSGDWAWHTGSWNINTTYHPDKFKDVAAQIKKSNMKFLLWFEPERVIYGTHSPSDHPKWYLSLKDDGEDMEKQTLLLDLGNPQALQGTFEMLAGYIEELNIDCYRQDFNFEPLTYWRKADTEGRQGIHEIKHIMGLYQLWDMLLERFPNLLIDNCASGGRRLDIELVSRSIALWRSDYQCIFDADPETTQSHTMGISNWLPYHGTGVGVVVGDTYRARSCYSSSLTNAYWSYQQFDTGDEAIAQWTRDIFAEYKLVRPYFSKDFYPLTENSLDNGTWCAWQFHDPETDSGIVMAFRRPSSPMTDAQLELKGLTAGGNYSVLDKDSKQSHDYSAKQLSNNFCVNLPDKRSSKLFIYTSKRDTSNP